MSGEVDLSKLTTETQVVAAGRPVKQPDGAAMAMKLGVL